MADVSKEALDRQPAAILGRAIQKAIDGGWKPSAAMKYQKEHPYVYIFNRDFAKALWGDYDGPFTPQNSCKVCGESHGIYVEEQIDSVISAPWKYHLQQMVIAEDSIKYLGENI